MISKELKAALPFKQRAKLLYDDIIAYIYGSLPFWYTERIEQEALYAGRIDKPKIFVVNAVFFFYLISIFFYPLSYKWISSPYIRATVSLTLLLFGLFFPYYVFSLMAESRKKEIEVVLPDLLLLTSANIKSGMTIDRALLFASRPEFGMLGREVKKVAFQIYGGKPLADAFEILTRRIKSDILQRTISLLLEGLRSGGAVAKLLEESATDIRNTETLKKEIKASVMMYGIFIFMAAVLGAPFMFAISNFLVYSSVEMWSGNEVELDPQFSGGGFIQIHTPEIDIEAFNMFSMAAILVTTFFAGILISLIMTGTAKAGLKLVPVFMVIGVLLFVGAKAVMFAAFGGIVG